MKTISLKDLMTIKETAAALDRSVQRVHAMIAEGKIKGRKAAPGLWLVEKKSVEEYLKARNARKE